MTDPEGQPGFMILIADNYHYGDQEHEYHAGQFRTWEEAVAQCQQIVDASLQHLLEPGMTAEGLWRQYVMFGEDPFIVPSEAERFSAWEYARRRCAEICRGDGHC